MRSNSITTAVIGTGFIGPVHVEALRRANVIVRGICGSSLEKSEAAASALGLAVGYAALEEALADDEVDVIHLATPNQFHFAQAKAALRAGKHVLCEKPLAMNSQESAELVRLAIESGRAAGVAYNIRFYPLCLEAAARVTDGQLGELLHIHGSYTQDWLLHETDFNWRVLADEGGELRAVTDIGTHWLDLAQFIAGLQVTEVCADLQTVHAQRRRPTGGADTFSGMSEAPESSETVAVDTEDAGAILLRLENGARGSVHVSQTTAGRKNCLRWEIAGTKQSMAWNSERPNNLWIGKRDAPNEQLIRDPALVGDTAQRFCSYPGGHNEGFPDTFKQLFRAFYDAIAADDFSASGAALYPTFADGHREILLCEAILQSHREQRWVSVADGATS